MENGIPETGAIIWKIVRGCGIVIFSKSTMRVLESRWAELPAPEAPEPPDEPDDSEDDPPGFPRVVGMSKTQIDEFFEVGQKTIVEYRWLNTWRLNS